MRRSSGSEGKEQHSDFGGSPSGLCAAQEEMFVGEKDAAGRQRVDVTFLTFSGSVLGLVKFFSMSLQCVNRLMVHGDLLFLGGKIRIIQCALTQINTHICTGAACSNASGSQKSFLQVCPTGQVVPLSSLLCQDTAETPPGSRQAIALQSQSSPGAPGESPAVLDGGLCFCSCDI